MSVVFNIDTDADFFVHPIKKNAMKEENNIMYLNLKLIYLENKNSYYTNT